MLQCLPCVHIWLSSVEKLFVSTEAIAVDRAVQLDPVVVTRRQHLLMNVTLYEQHFGCVLTEL